jgi:hypothetical protein
MQVTPGKFDATQLQGTPTPQISFTFYPEGMTGTASLTLNTRADVQVVQWTYTFDVSWPFDDSETIPFWTFDLTVVVPVSETLTVDYDGDGDEDDVITVNGQVTVVLTNVHLHWAWMETTPDAFTIDLDPSATFFTVCIDVDGDGVVVVCSTIDSTTAGGSLSASPTSAGVTTYHDPDTGTVTIVSAAPIYLDSSAISIGDPDADGDPDTVDITIAIPVSFSLTASIVGGNLHFTGGSVDVGPGTITVSDSASSADVDITASVPGASIPDTPLTVAGSDLYRTYGTITCTFSGTIPVVGTLDGTVD